MELKNLPQIELVRQRALEELRAWCEQFVNMSTSQTPRYSQISIDDDNNVSLKSTIAQYNRPLDIKLTDDESIDWIDFGMEVWQWWKAERTNFIVENYPAINPY